MTPAQFFEGRIAGFGVVLGLTGKVLRRFEVVMEGAWAEEHRALHLDETYTYLEGKGEFRRHWAIHFDEEGYILGNDAIEAARMRGRTRGPDFRIRFDRQRPRFGRLDPPHVVDFIEVGPRDCIMHGRARLFGLSVATVHAALRKQA